MNAFELFFVYGASVKRLFILGMLPQEDDFIELAENERVSYFENNPATEEKLFRMLVPENDERFRGMKVCMTETEKAMLLKAVDVINGYGKDKTFANDEEKLRYVAGRLPDVFSKGTRFEEGK